MGDDLKVMIDDIERYLSPLLTTADFYVVTKKLHSLMSLALLEGQLTGYQLATRQMTQIANEGGLDET